MSNRILNEIEEEMVMAATEETMMVVEETGMAPKEADIPMAVEEDFVVAAAEEEWVGSEGWKFYVQG